MKQKIKQRSIPSNAFIGPSEQILTEISQDILDVQRCLDTNTVIIKNPAKNAKQSKTGISKTARLKELKDIPGELSSESGHWNELKKCTLETSDSMQSNVSGHLKEANEYLSRLAKSTIQKSSDMISQGKDTISENTPKVSNPISKSLGGLFGRKKSLDQKDLDLLKRLAELKQEGILSSKEFALKKRQILEKL